ncbi:hypothetical protein M1512_03555 [Patescibacteria group bacterium]|nr:hypothetical protein [Patescibacteria group bacterium]
MKDITQSRLSSMLTVLVGAWLLLSPIWISITGGALVSLFITGGIITLAGLVQLFTDYSIPSYIVILSAIWLFLSAFVFTAVSNTVIWNETLEQ